MPEIKNTFTQGKMNKDLDERIIPNGQYREAHNVKVSVSDDSEVGTVQNVYDDASVVSAPTKVPTPVWSLRVLRRKFRFTSEATPFSRKVFILTGNNAISFSNRLRTAQRVARKKCFWPCTRRR